MPNQFKDIIIHLLHERYGFIEATDRTQPHRRSYTSSDILGESIFIDCKINDTQGDTNVIYVRSREIERQIRIYKNARVIHVDLADPKSLNQLDAIFND